MTKSLTLALMVATLFASTQSFAAETGKVKATAVYKGNPVLKSGKWSFCPIENGKTGKCTTVSGGSTKSRSLKPGTWLVKYCSNDKELSGERNFIVRAGVTNKGEVRLASEKN